MPPPRKLSRLLQASCHFLQGVVMPDSQQTKADLLLVAVTLIASLGWMFSKEALVGLPPLLFIGIRFLLAGTVLALVGGRELLNLNRVQIKQTLAVGLVFGVAICFWINGLHHAEHVGEGAFIIAMGLIMVPVVARLFFAEQTPPRTWVALPLACLGLACLSLNNGFRIEAGQLFFLVAALLFSVHFNLITHFVAKVPPMTFTAIQLWVVGAMALAVSNGIETWPQQVAPSIWGWLLASALVATSLRFWLQTYAQGLTSASHAAVIMILEPVWTALLAGLWLGEGMSLLQAIGCGLIFTALIVNRWQWVQLLLRELKTKQNA